MRESTEGLKGGSTDGQVYGIIVAVKNTLIPKDLRTQCT